MNAAAIAQHLNIAKSAIIKIEEWANVLFVVCRRIGARFVSYQIIKAMNEIDKPKVDTGLKLPELEGSEKQIAWAESIREKAVAEIFELQESNLEIIQCVLEAYDPILTQSKWWIDNRTTIDNSLRAKGRNLIAKSIKSYPVKQWELYPEEYAHEGEGGEWVWRCEDLDSEVFPGKADTEDLAFNIFCKHPETQQYEIWHYQIRV